MGGYISYPSNCVPSSTVKVTHWNGTIQDIQMGIKAAELMLDNPQHFLCHANSLQIGCRINHLTADEELDLGHLYLLLPMHKLHSVLSGTDMASLEFMANSAMKTTNRRSANSAMKTTNRRSSDARILSLFGGLMCPLPREMKKDVFFLEEGKQSSEAQEEQVAVPKLNLVNDPELSMVLAQLRFKKGMPWKPNLETITEVKF